MAKEPQNDLPLDVAQQDSVSGMAKRLMNPAHLQDLAHRAYVCARDEGLEQLWRGLDFRINLALHREKWQYRADLPTRRLLKAQRRAPLENGPCISVVVPLYNTPLPFLKQMIGSVTAQSYPKWQLVLVDASDNAHAEVGQLARRAAKDDRVVYQKIENEGIAANTTKGFALATGQYLTLLDHDDVLYPNALYEVAEKIVTDNAQLVYTDEVVLDGELKQLVAYHFKPNFSPDSLRGGNTITHLMVFSRKLLEQAGPEERSAYDGAQDFDLVLRLTEKADPARICHIPKAMYLWRGHAGSTAQDIQAKPYALEAGCRALNDHLKRIGLAGQASSIPGCPGAYRVQYELTGHPLVSVMIPNKDHIDDLERCLSSLYRLAGYDPFEVIVVENNSTDPATFAYYEEAKQRYPHLQVVTYEGGFNFSAVNNYGRRFAKGEHLLLLNNDIEVLTPGFLAELMMFSQRPDVGCVGAKLFYPDDTIQHAGVFLGINGTAGHSHKSHPRDSAGDLYRLATAQNMMAVTGACLMVKTALYDACGGLDEERFAVAYNDIDLCLKLYRQGLLNVFTPFAQCYHYESKSRGLDDSGPNAQRYAVEKQNFIDRYGDLIAAGDPYYNPHFNLLFENYGLK